MSAKYIVYPGTVTSQNDGDRHFIGFEKLCSLYGVNPAEAVDGWSREGFRADKANLIKLKPRFDGDYTLPTAP